jgi:release factor glutamine methyltransferase
LADIQNTLIRLQTSLVPWSDTPGLDSQTLLAHVLNRSRAWLLTHPDAALTREQDIAVEEAIDRIQKGEPLPYLIGHWEFFGLDFTLSPQVLIPRPETELLVEIALTWLQDHPERRSSADVGTGSGCIAVALAVNHPDLMVIATDISRSALVEAAQNASRHSVSARIRFVQADLLLPVRGKFDLICANLPYIPSSTLEQLVIFQKEPSLALDGGPAGLRLISRLLDGAPGWLAAGGLLLAELEASQKAAAYMLASERFPDADIQILPDLAGNDRLLTIQLTD